MTDHVRPVGRPSGATAPPTRRRRVRTHLAALLCLALVASILGTSTRVEQADAAVGAGFNLNRSDIRFILKQIKIAEQHAATATPQNPCGTLLGGGPNQIPNQNGQGVELPWGLRTVDGSCNNLVAGRDGFGSAAQVFPRMTTPEWRDAEPAPFGPPGPASSYAQTSGTVYDSEPRVISNLISDQTAANPAAVAAAGENPDVSPSGALDILNVAPDVGLSSPYNSWFTLFGQFFDHGLDFTRKSGGTVFMPLQPDDPLYDPAGHTNFMVLTRSTNQPGPDGVVGDDPSTPQDESADDVKEATNETSPFVDQSQTYGSHPSQHVFLREYELDGNGKPVSTGHMLTSDGDGMSTWAVLKEQARTMLGIDLSDAEALAVPLLATDPYGRFVRGPDGYPQMVTTGGLVEGDPTANGGQGVPVPATVIHAGNAFLDDIAHNAVPRPGLVPDADSAITGPHGVQDEGTYDDEMLDAHYMAGDGRVNENVGLVAVHHVFHSEHNRLAEDIKNVITTKDPTNLAEWQLADGSWNGERLLQAARFVTEMEYQHLAFEEFARKVQPQVNVFSGYDRSINSAIQAEFAHAVYRFGHSMLNETVARTRPNGSSNDLFLLEAFLNPPAFDDGGTLSPGEAAGQVAQGMIEQQGNELDEFVTEALRNQLLGLPLDLAALNLARAREAGVPRLNDVRRDFYADTNNPDLRPYANWNEFGFELKHQESLINFVAAYGTHPTITGDMATRRAAAELIMSGDATAPADSFDFMNGTGPWADSGGITTTGLDDVDLWIGGLAEKQQPFGGLLGSTFNHVFELQMENLQDGDRFYYLSRTAGLNLLVQLEGNSFSEMIERNTSATNLPADAFARMDFHFYLDAQNASGPIVDDPNTDYDERQLLIRLADGTIRFNGGEHVAFHGTAATDWVHSSEGDDTVRGNDGDDDLEGGSGNDSIIAGLGDDILTDVFGDDVTKGGDGNDAISSGQGFDLNQAGRGNDFVVGGSDPTETFGGPGDDFIYGGESFDTVFGDDGDDWIEGGPQADLLQGDNGAPFQDDPNEPGHDVIDGDGGADDYDAEGGDDIMVSGPGIERNEGMLGFDWVTHESDPVAANSDMNFTGLLPPSVEALRDRFDEVEGLSGWDFDDVLRGTDYLADEMVGHELDADGIDRISGLADVVDGASSFTGGNIILGGAGSDILEGRGGDDILDGDKYLHVRISVRDADDPSVEIDSVESMGEVQSQIFDGSLNPGQLRIVREILDNSNPDDVDTAVFTGPMANYTVTVNDDSITVQHLDNDNGVDGTDTLYGIERLAFSDQVVEYINQPGQSPPTGTIILSSVTPIEGLPMTATRAFDDPDLVVPSTIEYTWQLETEPGVWASLAPGTTFTPTDPGPVVGRRLRVVATFLDRDGVLEHVTSIATDPVVNINNAPTGAPTLSDTTPQAGNAVAASIATIGDDDGLAGAVFGYQWQERTGSGGWSAIGGADGASFTPGNAQVGRQLRVRVTWTDDHGTDEALTSAGTDPVSPPPDLTAPEITGRTPAPDATGVAVGADVDVTFSEDVTGVGPTTALLTRVSTGDTVAVDLAPANPGATVGALTMDPVADLAPGEDYTVTLTSGITDLADPANPLADSQWSFTTDTPAAPDTTPPTVSPRTPAADATGVGRGVTVRARFSERVSGIDADSVQLVNTVTGDAVPAVLTPAGPGDRTSNVVINPDARLDRGTLYRVTFNAGIVDLAGNPLAPTSWTFTTRGTAGGGGGGDTTAPTVAPRNPAAGAVDVGRGVTVRARFSERVSGIDADSVQLVDTVTGNAVPAVLTPADPSTRTGSVVINPDARLDRGTTYRVTFGTGIVDNAGNPLAPTSWDFTVVP